MVDKKNKVGPQGTQVFDLNEVESLLAEQLKQQATEGKGSPALIGISKPFSGKRFMLKDKVYQVGRKHDCSIQLDEPSVSSAHAKLVYSDDQWKVINLLSSNGTFVNGDKVSESDIYPGDRVRFGGVEFMFSLVEEGRAAKRSGKGMGIGAKVGIIGIIVIAALGGAAYYLM
ncbi:FHA domain-containing protein [Pleionea sediminis]|uniref:FHA domain-containing protein n=1 Tax=Pleionea sediminis TaxID=2569479 RepID=UPI001184D6B7|nr:FHA domain-containing protein [Pleionea sediminis]